MSVEKNVKQQFAKIFEKSDWTLFKGIAESYLEQAARLRKKDLRRAPQNLRLLARNCQKRLFIGIAVELLLKAAYLHQGYCINVLADGHGPLDWPYTAEQVKTRGFALNPDRTQELNECIQKFTDAVVKLGDQREAVLEGLRMAKVYRNKEGHIVAPKHDYVPSDYHKIESALILFYREAFSEALELRFSLAPKQKSIFRVSAVSQHTK
jgi:hypothetical protein